jgi:hypothetical protein
VLWIEHWPTQAKPHKPGTSEGALAISLYERMQGDDRYTPEQRSAALQSLPNGDERVAKLIFKALSSERLYERVAAQQWVSRESDHRVLAMLEKALMASLREGDAGPRLLVPMFRNPKWVNEDKWRTALKTWSTDSPVHVALTRRLLLELGHARGDPTDEASRKDNRMRASILFGLAKQREKIVAAGRGNGIDSSLHLALECLARAGYTDEKHRGKANRKLRAGSSKPEILMRLRRKFDVNESTWNITTIDVEGPRETDLPLVILQDPDMSEELYLPWMVEVDLHFRCYLIDYQSWARDFSGQYGGTTPMEQRGPQYVAYLAERLDELCERLGLRRYAVLAPGFMGAVAMDLCRRPRCGVAFASVDAWPSHDYLLKRYALTDAYAAESRRFRAEMLRKIGGGGEVEADPDRPLIDEAILDNWLGAKPNLGGAGTDSLHRSAEELGQWMRRLEPHPAAWLSHYEFTNRAMRPRPPVVLLHRLVDIDKRTYAEFHAMFATPSDAPRDLPKHEAIWHGPPSALVEYLMKSLKWEKVIAHGKD